MTEFIALSELGASAVFPLGVLVADAGVRCAALAATG
jgi:hypothetical protein